MGRRCTAEEAAIRCMSALLARPEHVDRDIPPTIEELRAAVRRVVGIDLTMRQPRWLSRFTDAARQADRYHADRVLLAGDAAHIQLPAGGPGMSTALQDVLNLGWKLAAQVKGWHRPACWIPTTPSGTRPASGCCRSPARRVSCCPRAST